MAEQPVQTPVPKIIQCIFWPIALWPSFGHMKNHAADDYVGRTSPLMGTAIGFWVCAVALLLLWVTTKTGILVTVDAGSAGAESGNATFISRATTVGTGVLMFFLPLLYIIGFWMFSSREDKYPN